MQLFNGTSGYSYKEWKGTFYPEKIADAEMLSYYSGKLPAVEINNTFYRMPKSAVLENWKDQVPDDFRFVLKASRRITHMKRLKEADDETAYLFSKVGKLGKKLGVILFQMPPYLRLDVERLEKFVDLLPPDYRCTFEFRHDTWNDPAVLECLKQKKCAWCVVDTTDEKPKKIDATADWGYLRLRRENYRDKDLKEWVKLIKDQDWKQVYVFFKHEDDGAGPALAARFRDLF